MKRKIVTVIVLLCVYVSGFMTAVMKPRPSPFYGVLLEDINLELFGKINNQPMFGIIKKGTVVQTGNLIKGETVGVTVGSWISRDNIRFVGDEKKLRDYLASRSVSR